MPNRVIRDAILDSEAYHALSIDARCLFIELILCADDYGLVPIGHLYLKRHTPTCEGKSAQAIDGLLEQIAAQQMMAVYQSDSGNRFAAILKFGNGPRALKPKWPLPPEPLLSKINELHEKRIARAMQTHSRRAASAPVTVTVGVTETVTEKKKKRTGTRAPRADRPVTPLPDDFSLTDQLLAYGRKVGLTAAETQRGFERFCNNARAKAHAYADWAAAFRTWCDYDGERKRKEDPPLDLTEGGKYVVA